MDSQMLKMKWRIVQQKIKQVAKTIGKTEDNRKMQRGRSAYEMHEYLKTVENPMRNKR